MCTRIVTCLPNGRYTAYALHRSPSWEGSQGRANQAGPPVCRQATSSQEEGKNKKPEAVMLLGKFAGRLPFIRYGNDGCELAVPQLMLLLNQT